MSTSKPQGSRNVKGIIQVDLIKFLRVYQRSTPLPRLSPAAEELLQTRVIVSAWYPLAPFLELIMVTDRVLLKGNEEAAVELGAGGGTNLLRTSYRAYIREGDAAESVMGVRHLWGTHYDFGAIHAELEADRRSVVYTVTGYEDVVAPHGLMTAGWAIAAARIAGAPAARIELLERPWAGDEHLRYRVILGTGSR